MAKTFKGSFTRMGRVTYDAESGETWSTCIHVDLAAREIETQWAYVPEGRVYDVPYGTLVPSGRNELWVAGRCFSATHDAHASCRSMAQTMSMGQAAGLAAATSLRNDKGARDLDVGQLQERLRQLGAVLELPEELADTTADGWGRNRRFTEQVD